MSALLLNVINEDYQMKFGYLNTNNRKALFRVHYTLNCASLPVPPAPAGLEAGVELLMIVCVGRKSFITLIH